MQHVSHEYVHVWVGVWCMDVVHGCLVHGCGAWMVHVWIGHGRGMGFGCHMGIWDEVLLQCTRGVCSSSVPVQL